MSNKEIIGLIFALLVISSTCVLIDNQEKQQDELRQTALVAFDRLQNDKDLTVPQAETCAGEIHRAVRNHAITYQELGVGSYFTIEEMVKHIGWGWKDCKIVRSN
ncbi:MAG: hypothetical protein PHX30_05330 [Candidatus Pacebacteria bacterium]|jgi:hypothetical protein|nr:hypothetical protein [Candidatus Paceibacterota bacterium]